MIGQKGRAKLARCVAFFLGEAYKAGLKFQALDAQCSE